MTAIFEAIAWMCVGAMLVLTGHALDETPEDW